MVESVGVTLTANWMLLLCATIVSNWVFPIDVPCLLRTRIGPDHSGHSFSTPGESLKYHQHRHYHQFLTPAIPGDGYEYIIFFVFCHLPLLVQVILGIDVKTFLRFSFFKLKALHVIILCKFF